MTDDIATRLRNWHDQRDSWQTLTEAADEIEDQRKRVEYWSERCMRAEECVRFLQKKKWWQK